MTSPSPAVNPHKDQAAATEAPDFATEVHRFWEKNRSLVLLLCAAILLAITAYEGLRYFNAMRDQNGQDDYAQAAGSPDRLAGFAAEHSGHALASVALLQQADAKYANGEFPAAVTSYQKALSLLTNPTLKARARLGIAVSRLNAGDQTAGEADLKAMSSDASIEKTIRTEATYHLATLANETGRVEEARQLLDEVAKLDGMGLWGQRALQLRASLMLPGAPALSLKPQ